MEFYVLANTTGGGLSEPGLSGGDRITIECIKRWAQAGHQIKIFISKSGQIMYERYQVRNVEFIVTNRMLVKKYSPILILLFEIWAVIKGCKAALDQKLLSAKDALIYSVSDFWPDALPAFILKLRNSKVNWVASFYLFAPTPWQKDSPYRGRTRLIGLIYWLSQLPIYWIVKRYADLVFVTSEPDVKKFVTKRRDRSKVIVIRGGVDTKTPAEVPEPQKKKYDAVFIGRFHPQKGVLELIDIWKRVVTKKPPARLALIGEGLLEEEIRSEINKQGLSENVDLLGFQDGIPKIRIFKESKIVVHPAIYDSGGMAACEAMAAGLPGVSFDLEALKTYYPKGMIKTPCFDLRAFSNNILKLLEDSSLYEKTKHDALEWSREWDWAKRAEEILDTIKVNLDHYENSHI